MELDRQAVLQYGLLRHGETTWNSEKRVQGHGDSPLTPTGIATLRRWAQQLASENWQHILCSDLGRVRQSVEILNEVLQLPVTIESRLREQNWGLWEGMRVKEVYEHYADELALQVGRGWDFRPPAGESRREVRDRLFQALENHRRRQHRENTLVVCHLGVIKCAVYSVAGRRFLEEEPPLLKKGAMHSITYDNGYALGRLNIPLQRAAL